MKMPSADVTVIVVNYNSGQLLQQCLKHVALQSLKPACVLVIDNCSTDGSSECADQYSDVRIRRLTKNLGFAGANNLAIAECKTKYIALLNPDAFADFDWLRNLIAAADQRLDISVFGSRQMMANKPSFIDGLGDIYHLSGYVQRSGYGRALCLSDLHERAIFSASACAALYRTAALEKVGGFDEDFFCYIEDVDLGFRLQLAGFKALFVPAAVVHHLGSATTGGHRSDFSIYYGHRNLVWAFFKNMPGLLFWVFLPFHIGLNIFSILLFISKGKGKVILKAKWDALKGLHKILRKRRRIQESRRVSIAEIWQILDKRVSNRRFNSAEILRRN